MRFKTSFITVIGLLSSIIIGCSSESSNSQHSEEIVDSVVTVSEVIIDDTSHVQQEITPSVPVVVPKFSISKRVREDYNDYTPRTRYHIRIPKKYSVEELDIIADSLLRKERTEYGISEIWVNYYLPKMKIASLDSYALSMRLRTESKSTIHQTIEETAPRGYNPPKMRDLSKANFRETQIWGAFDRGQLAGYEVGYKDGKKRRRFHYSYNSEYPTSDEWIEQSYKQGYEVGYTNGYDDAGGNR